MAEAISKLRPDRTIHLRGFDGFGAAAALYAASASGFTVSGVFRDSADFAVLILWDADNFFEHPRMKYLPDFSFAGAVLQFDVQYTRLQPLDSQKFPTIDWPFLDVIRPDNSTAQVNLFANARLVGGNYSTAAGSFTVQANAPLAGDSLSVWYQNLAFQYTATGGDTADQAAQALATAINGYDWTTAGGLSALWADALNGTLVIAYARYGRVMTAGKVVTQTAGQNFVGLKPGDPILVGATETTVVSVVGATSLTVADDLGAQTGAPYLAERGGYDGNMVNLYSLATSARLSAEAVVKLAGGDSDATWRVTLDFTALGIDQVRQMFLTFAPRLADGAAYSSEEWDAVFTNWAVTDPGGVCQLQVAAPNSVRVEETDFACAYSGASWGSEAGFYSQGFARRASTPGDSVNLSYHCTLTHDLYLGTALAGDRGQWGVSVDGDAETLLDCYLPVTDPVVTRRKLRTALTPGAHTLKLVVRAANPLSQGNNCYFDFVDAAVLGDVPEAPGSFVLRSPALDFDTDHTYKNSPQRVMWWFDRLGFSGPMNEYLGVFWWAQRKNAGAVLPLVTTTFSGVFAPGDQVLLNIGSQVAGKTVFAADTLATIVSHLAYFINETFSGVWAAAVGPVLTVASRSPVGGAYNFTFSAAVQSAGGLAAVTGSLAGGQPGDWVIDPSIDPPVNYAVRKWHADFYAQVAARGLSVTTSCSMELVNTPDDPGNGHVWAARFPDGAAVTTDTGFSSLKSTQCAPMASEFLAYQRRVYLALAGLQAAAGLTPELQFGEFEWWFFSNLSGANPNGGMAYYDAETSAAALAALGRPLALFQKTTDDPGVNGGADAAFLAGRLAGHVAAIGAAVRAAYPAALLELLWPYDVNYPKPIGRESLGGRLNYAVNLPVEWKGKAGSGLDRFKVEALDFGSGTRSLDLALQAIRLPGLLGWPLDSIRYLFPIFNGGCPWEAEYLQAVDAQIVATTPFAMDHQLLLGWRIEEPVARPEASWL